MQDADRPNTLGSSRSPTDSKPNAVLREQLTQILNASASDQDLDAQLKALESEHDDDVYSELIHLLANLRFPPADARAEWGRIFRHRGAIQHRLGSWVDPRVAVIDYYLSVDRQLHNPTVVEMASLEQTHRLAYRDALTGLHNYRFFGECLSREVARSRRDGAPLSFLMVDIDDFKSHNDRFGHDESNVALTRIASLLIESLREEDVATRFGGEEFAIMLPGTPKIGAALVAERVRQTIESGMAAGSGQPGELTVSIGVATFPADAEDAIELVRRSDRALYAAKSRGKNCVELFGNSSRSHRRVQATLPGRFRRIASESHDLTTLSISAGGILLSSSEALPVGVLIEIDLTLPDSGTVVRIPGEVINVKQTASGSYEATVRTIEIASRDRQALSRYVPS